MSISSSIMYGYDLGGREEGWEFTKYDPETYDYIWPSWMEMDDGDEPDDPISQCQDRLLKVLGGFEDSDDWKSSDQEISKAYYARKKAAEELVGVTFDMYGVYDYTGWVVGFQIHDSYGSLNEIEEYRFVSPPQEWDAKLAKVLEALEFTLEDQPKPRLLALCSYT
jgi:hypothetical protein